MKLRYSVVSGVIILVVCSFLGSCAGGKKVKKPRYDCSKRITLAIEKYNKKKYSSVKTLIDDAKIQCAGASGLDTAGYYLGMSLLKMKLYDESRLEFTRLMQEYPNSPFYEEALFRIAYAAYKGSRPVDRDQTETKESARLLNDFLENYPSSAFADSAQKYMKQAVNKLALKEFEVAKFYQKIGEKEAAIISYRSFIREYPAVEYTQQAYCNLGQVLIDLNRLAEARDVLNTLVEQEPKGEIAKKARELLARCAE
ncbi:MAG: outer membrane protein assembly factor BamD [Chitinispirillaceae bacterium]|nr:outer membrane protein assembly factor BamD [Chitinispirillaceae bacterium]